MKTHEKDERIIESRRLVNQYILYALLIYLGIASIFQHYFLHANRQQTIVELLGWIGAIILMQLGYSIKAVGLTEQKEINWWVIIKNVLLNSIIFFTAFIFIFGVNLNQSLLYTFIYAIFITGFKLINQFINIRKNKMIEEKINDID